MKEQVQSPGSKREHGVLEWWRRQRGAGGENYAYCPCRTPPLSVGLMPETAGSTKPLCSMFFPTHTYVLYGKV